MRISKLVICIGVSSALCGCSHPVRELGTHVENRNILYTAVEAGDLRKGVSLLDDGANPNVRVKGWMHFSNSGWREDRRTNVLEA